MGTGNPAGLCAQTRPSVRAGLANRFGRQRVRSGGPAPGPLQSTGLIEELGSARPRAQAMDAPREIDALQLSGAHTPPARLGPQRLCNANDPKKLRHTVGPA